jgi:hypothetical protein
MMAYADDTVGVKLIMYPAEVRVSLKRYFENFYLISIMKNKYILKGIFSVYFFRFPKENSKTMKWLVQRSPNNQVGNKMIIQLQDNIYVCVICIYYFTKGTQNQRLQYKSKHCIKWSLWNQTHAFLLAHPSSNL